MSIKTGTINSILKEVGRGKKKREVGRGKKKRVTHSVSSERYVDYNNGILPVFAREIHPYHHSLLNNNVYIESK